MTNASVQFVHSNRSALWTRGLLFAIAAMSLIAILSGLLQASLLSHAAGGVGVSPSDASANDARQQIIGLLQVALLLCTAVAFPIWFYRAHKNLPSLGATDLKYSPRWAAGGFFVPFLNLVRPFQVMREVWHGSNPATVRVETDSSFSLSGLHRDDRTPPLVGWWWGLFLISNFVGNIAGRLAFRTNPTISDLQAMTWAQIFSDILDVPSAIIAARLVGVIHRWQAQRSLILATHATSTQSPSESALPAKR